MNSDFDALLSRLAQHRVKYLIVGGYAVIHYCEPRYTKEFAGPLTEVSDEDLRDPKRVIMMGRPPRSANGS